VKRQKKREKKTSRRQQSDNKICAWNVPPFSFSYLPPPTRIISKSQKIVQIISRLLFGMYICPLGCDLIDRFVECVQISRDTHTHNKEIVFRGLPSVRLC
jgi:hypothetical protein